VIDSVAGIIIWTDDVQRLAAFYRDILGLPVHSERPDFVAFEFGAFRLSIGRHDRVTGASRDPFRFMVNLGVSEIQETHAALRGKGVEFLRPPEQESWGGWIATFSDPDGNILQLLQQPPPSI
jgi:predicted enzyme related to lactoylglutathione lyase